MDGNTLSIGHNTDTTISSVTDPTGRALTYAYYGGKLATVTDPLGRVWSFAYGTAGGTSSSNLWYGHSADAERSELQRVVRL